MPDPHAPSTAGDEARGAGPSRRRLAGGVVLLGVMIGPVVIPVALLVSAGLDLAAGALVAGCLSLAWAAGTTFLVLDVTARMPRSAPSGRRPSRAVGIVMAAIALVVYGALMTGATLSTATGVVPSRHDAIRTDFGDADESVLLEAGRTLGTAAVALAVAGPVAGWLVGRRLRRRPEPTT